MSLHLRNKMSKAGCVMRLVLLVSIIASLGYLFFSYIYQPDDTPYREAAFDEYNQTRFVIFDIKSQQELDSLTRAAYMYYGNTYIDSILNVESTNAKLIKIRTLLKDTSSVVVRN